MEYRFGESRRKMLARRPKLEHLLTSEAHLVSAACALGATSVKTLSPAEEKLCRKAAISYDSATRNWLEQYIQKGNDPLGDVFCRLRSPELRREKGATYTPPTIVRAMVRWALSRK